MDPSSALNTMATQNRADILQSNSLQREENAKTAVFQMEMRKLQTERAQKNVLKKQMNAMLADVMTILKKGGDQIRQTN